MAGGHNKVEYSSGSHLKESSFRSKGVSVALALSLGRGLRRIVARIACHLLPYAGVVTRDQRPQ